MIYSAINFLAEPIIWLCAFLAIACAFSLSRGISPILHELEKELRRNPSDLEIRPDSYFLAAVEDRYEVLVTKTDEVSAHDFSVAEISHLRIKILRFYVSASKLQDFVCQAPALLISFGLLGTFAGLTGGLTEIQTVLQPNISPQQAANGLSQVIAPMSLAFRTSFLGLVLSLSLSITYQLTGWKSLLDQCEGLLTGWLETVVPIRLGKKLATPLRASIDSLNQTSKALPEKIAEQVGVSIQLSFKEKLDDFFNLYSNLACETSRLVNSLGVLAAAFRDSSGDFLSASEAFNQCDFAKDLQNAVSGLERSKNDLLDSSLRLCERFALLREDLGTVHSDWQILTKLSAEELRQSSTLMQITNEQQDRVTQLIGTVVQGSEGLTFATKELRQTRLEVGRDRKALQDVASALQVRLEAGTELSRSYKLFTESMSGVLDNWKSSTVQMGELYSTLVDRSRDDHESILANSQIELARYRDSTSSILNELQAILQDHENNQSTLIELIRQQESNVTEIMASAEHLIMRLNAQKDGGRNQ